MFLPVQAYAQDNLDDVSQVHGGTGNFARSIHKLDVIGQGRFVLGWAVYVYVSEHSEKLDESQSGEDDSWRKGFKKTMSRVQRSVTRVQSNLDEMKHGRLEERRARQAMGSTLDGLEGRMSAIEGRMGVFEGKMDQILSLLTGSAGLHTRMCT